MKSFNEICRFSQKALKEYMQSFLAEKQYDVVNETGFLYAKGDVPVLLLAHMDTVHKVPCTEIKEKDGIISSPQGIGGDDRCGIFIIMNIVNELKCSVLLCEDEEIGGVGARAFAKSQYVKDLGVNYMIEFDRKGKEDAVFYNCDNKKFTEFVTSKTGFKEAFGSFSDISIVAPEAKVAAVNLSSGYYEPHTTNEYVVYAHMMHTAKVATKLIEAECEKFEYIRKVYTYPATKYTGTYAQQSFYDYNYPPNNNKKSKKKSKGNKNNYSGIEQFVDFDLHLEVIWINEYGKEECYNTDGSTKAEAWLNFFMDNPSVCFDMILDYSFC